MNEQQQECYGIPYAMHNHDIERIEETSYVFDMYVGTFYEVKGVNSRLREGWVLLAIGQNASEDGAEPVYIMGVPRPKFCDGGGALIMRASWGFSPSPKDHERTQMIWHHESKRWACVECDHQTAIDAPDQGDGDEGVA